MEAGWLLVAGCAAAPLITGPCPGSAPMTVLALLCALIVSKAEMEG